MKPSFDSVPENHGPAPGQRIIGSPFNPSKRYCGFYPADVVSKQKTYQRGEQLVPLSDGPKRLYDRLARWSSNENGTCFWSFARMAEELGKSERQIRSDMRVLEEAALVRHHRRRGGRRSNTYELLWHAWFERERAGVASPVDSSAEGERERRQTAAESAGFSAMTAGRARQDRASLNGSGLPTNYVIESQNGNNLSASTDSSSSSDEEINDSSEKSKNNDDGNSVNDAEERLIRLIEHWTKRTPDAKLIRDIKSELAKKAVTLTQFLEDVRPRLMRLSQPPGEGFFLHQAREFGDSADASLGRRRWREMLAGGLIGADSVSTQTRQTARCTKCHGGGYLQINPERYCDCEMGVELERAQRKKVSAASQPDFRSNDRCA